MFLAQHVKLAFKGCTKNTKAAALLLDLFVDLGRLKDRVSNPWWNEDEDKDKDQVVQNELSGVYSKYTNPNPNTDTNQILQNEKWITPFKRMVYQLVWVWWYKRREC